MNFAEKYSIDDIKKIILSNDAYALCESLQELIAEIKIAFRKTN